MCGLLPDDNKEYIAPVSRVRTEKGEENMSRKVVLAALLSLVALTAVSFVPSAYAIPGDLNGDDVVDIIDIAQAALAFGSAVGDPGYDPEADMNVDGIIDLFDLVMIVLEFT